MPEFLNLVPPADALRIFIQAIPETLPTPELVRTPQALNRVVARSYLAENPLPEFTRSSVDGYAVRAKDTFGASDAQPGYLRLTGEVRMGSAADQRLEPGSCVLIHTGGMLPEDADAVIMMEYTQAIRGKPGTDEGIVEVTRAVSKGENLILEGEDVKRGQEILSAGRRMRPAEIGGCMAMGITEILVSKKPRVGIFSSGDEVIPPDVTPLPGQVRDVNSYSLAALVEQAGGEPVLYGIVKDDPELLLEQMRAKSNECEILVVTAGSSASARDTTALAISKLGPPGVLVHGVNIRPGKPTILAICEKKIIIGLPGNPVSAVVIAKIFLVPAIEKLLGLVPVPHGYLQSRLAVNLSSQAGREEWIAVKIRESTWDEKGKEDISYTAEPIFGKSNLIFTLVFADGMICVPQNRTGLESGEIVQVQLW